MTRTKAIERLNGAKVKIKIPKAAVTARETNDAIDMAIEALENENALLDRVLEIINAEHDSVTNRMNIDKEYVSVYTVIKEIREAVLALKRR